MASNPSDPGKILIVDDDPSIVYFFEKTLRRDGHTVVSAASGEAALQAMAILDFDVALLDIKMKGMDGLAVLAKIHERSPATMVIMVTAHASLDTAVAALREGAFDYLFKPCSIEALRTSVERGLHKRHMELRRSQLELPSIAPAASTDPPAHPATPRPQDAWQGSKSKVAPPRFIQYDDLIVDPVRHVMTLGGVPLELSVMEFNLLSYLTQEAPRVISAEELVRDVQHYVADSAEARETIRSHIYHLRVKIRRATGREVIRTVRGVGYVITTD